MVTMVMTSYILWTINTSYNFWTINTSYTLWTINTIYILWTINTSYTLWTINNSFSLLKCNLFKYFPRTNSFASTSQSITPLKDILHFISIVKPTRCNNVTNLFILEWHSTCFGRSFRLSSGAQDCKYSNFRLMSNGYCWLLAVSSICLTYACCCMFNLELLMEENCCMYSLELLMMDGKTVRNM